MDSIAYMFIIKLSCHVPSIKSMFIMNRNVLQANALKYSCWFTPPTNAILILLRFLGSFSVSVFTVKI